MYLARLICSDPECEAEIHVEAETIEELEALACECGCAMEIVGWPDWLDDPAPILGLPNLGGGELREAA